MKKKHEKVIPNIIKSTHYFRSRTSYQQSSMVVVVWCFGAALLLQHLNDLTDGSVIKCTSNLSDSITQEPNQAHLVYAWGQWPQAHKQVWPCKKTPKKTKMKTWSGLVNKVLWHDLKAGHSSLKTLQLSWIKMKDLLPVIANPWLQFLLPKVAQSVITFRLFS